MNDQDKKVVIDCFPESARRYRKDFTVVAIDVIRATTTAISGVVTGRRCFPVASVDDAFALSKILHNPLLVGELGGNMPYGFHITNSPALIAEREDIRHQMILLSSSA